MAIRYYTYEIVERFPHNPSSYTEGLVYHENHIYESTGINGESKLLKTDIRTGLPIKTRCIKKKFFAEGLTIFQGRIFQLTYTTSVGFVYDLATFEKIRNFRYRGGGWRLTHDSEFLIMSNGTQDIQFLDPYTFDCMKIIKAHFKNPISGERTFLKNLNALAYINNEIYANLYVDSTNCLYNHAAIINPGTGEVTGIINLQGLFTSSNHSSLDIIANGIAYDDKEERLFITGKGWPSLFQIRLIESIIPPLCCLQ